MENRSDLNLSERQIPGSSSSVIKEGGEPTKYDEMITDILKYLTTLNTGLLAILAAFNQAILPVFKLNATYTTYFVLAFYISLLLCMLGFVTTVFILRKGYSKKSHLANLARDIMVVTAAVSYILALMFFLALFTLAYQSS